MSACQSDNCSRATDPNWQFGLPIGNRLSVGTSTYKCRDQEVSDMAVRQQANEPVRGSVLADDGSLSSLAVTGLNEHTNDAVFRPGLVGKSSMGE